MKNRKGKKLKGKKIKSILLIAVFILSTLAIAIPMASATSLTIHLGPELEAWTDGLVDWVTDPVALGTQGRVAELSQVDASDGYAYVRVYPASTITLGTLSATNMPTFKYYMIEPMPPALELRFEDPSSAGNVDVTIFAYPEHYGEDWSGDPNKWLTTTTTAIMNNNAFFCGAGPDTNPILDSDDYPGQSSQPLSYVQSYLGGLGYGNWVLTRVSPQIGETDPQKVLIDDIKVGTVTYGLEEKDNVGDKIVVSGTTDTLGGLVKVYWDSVKTWDGTAGYLAETYAVGPSYSVKITIPDARAGNHYVTVKNIETNKQVSKAFTVNPKIVLSPTSGIKGDPITVTGTGFTESTADSSTLVGMSLIGVVGEKIATGGGAAVKIFGAEPLAYLTNKPIKPETIKITATVDGARVTITDTPGTLPFGTLENGAVSGTINYETGAWALTFTTGPDIGTPITASYEFATPIIPAISPATLKTSSLGSFTGTFTIPEDAEDQTYTVKAAADAVFATATLNVGTVITLTPNKGLSGTEVTVIGRGFDTSSYVDITWKVTAGYILLLVDDYPTDSLGGFTTTFDAPPVNTGQKYDVTAEDIDDKTTTATAKFTLTGITDIKLVPKSGLPGTPVTVTGEWFTAGKTVTVYFDGVSVDTETADKDMPFDFEKTITIPVDATYGAHTIKARDSEGVYDTATFTVVKKVTTIETRSDSYDPGDTISFDIYSTVEFKGVGVPIVYETIDIEIDDPDGYLFWDLEWMPELIDTATWGVPYSVQQESDYLILPSDAKPGIWTWTAEYYLKTTPGTKLTTTGTFVVGEPVGPHPDIPAETTNQKAKDSTGAIKSSFVLGETVLASAKVTNIGTQSQPMLIMIQWKDPQLRALAPVFILVELAPGDYFTYAPGLTIPLTGYTTGTWTAKVLVFDTWIAQGGVTKGTPVTITITVTG